MATEQDVFDVAARAAQQHRVGDVSWQCADVRGCAVDVVTFDLETGGYCARFVRQCHDAALGKGEWHWTFAAPTAREMEKALRAAGLGIQVAAPGCVVALNNQSYWAGHIAIYLGAWDGGVCIAENTSSKWRGDPQGPGTKISPLADVAGEVSGYYQPLAAGEAVAPRGYDPGPIVVQLDDFDPVDAWFTGEQAIVGVKAIAASEGLLVQDLVRQRAEVIIYAPSAAEFMPEPMTALASYVSQRVTVTMFGGPSCKGWFTDHTLVGVRDYARLRGYELVDEIVGKRRVRLRS